jgi:hypothetical protein
MLFDSSYSTSWGSKKSSVVLLKHENTIDSYSSLWFLWNKTSACSPY